MCQNKESFCITDFTVAMWTVCVISILTLWSSYALKLRAVFYNGKMALFYTIY